MADLNRDSSAICPFFLRSKVLDNRRATITCEGIVANTEITTTFRCKADMDAYRGRFCEMHTFMLCPCAKAANEKYGREENE